MFSAAASFHNTLFINGVHVTDRSDVDTYKIIGVDEDTITCAAFDENNNYDFYYYSSEGDGTVPTYSALNNASKYSYKTYAYFKKHTDLIKYSGCVQLIIDIINEEPYVYYNPNEATLSTEDIKMADGLVTSDSKAKSSNRITIVAKDINDLQLENDEGVIYAIGDELFYDTQTGEKQRVGTVWQLGDKSYQFVLFEGSYKITSVSMLNANSSIRIDYCNYGLSDNAVLFNNMNSGDVIQIRQSATQTTTEQGVSIYRVSE